MRAFFKLAVSCRFTYFHRWNFNFLHYIYGYVFAVGIRTLALFGKSNVHGGSNLKWTELLPWVIVTARVLLVFRIWYFCLMLWQPLVMIWQALYNLYRSLRQHGPKRKMFALGTVITLISQCPSTNLTPLLLFFSRASPLSTELGQSKSAKAPAAVGTPAPAGFLKEVCEALNLTPAVVISPSLSGMYSLPFLLEHQALVRAYIPVAPICTDKFTAEQYQSVKVESVCEDMPLLDIPL